MVGTHNNGATIWWGNNTMGQQYGGALIQWSNNMVGQHYNGETIWLEKSHQLFVIVFIEHLHVTAYFNLKWGLFVLSNVSL